LDLKAFEDPNINKGLTSLKVFEDPNKELTSLKVFEDPNNNKMVKRGHNNQLKASVVQSSRGLQKGVLMFRKAQYFCHDTFNAHFGVIGKSSAQSFPKAFPGSCCCWGPIQTAHHSGLVMVMFS
jgi:hypothetical protein